MGTDNLTGISARVNEEKRAEVKKERTLKIQQGIEVLAGHADQRDYSNLEDDDILRELMGEPVLPAETKKNPDSRNTFNTTSGKKMTLADLEEEEKSSIRITSLDDIQKYKPEVTKKPSSVFDSKAQKPSKPETERKPAKTGGFLGKLVPSFLKKKKAEPPTPESKESESKERSFNSDKGSNDSMASNSSSGGKHMNSVSREGGSQKPEEWVLIDGSYKLKKDKAVEDQPLKPRLSVVSIDMDSELERQKTMTEQLSMFFESPTKESSGESNSLQKVLGSDFDDAMKFTNQLGKSTSKLGQDFDNLLNEFISSGEIIKVRPITVSEIKEKAPEEEEEPVKEMAVPPKNARKTTQLVKPVKEIFEITEMSPSIFIKLTGNKESTRHYQSSLIHMIQDTDEFRFPTNQEELEQLQNARFDTDERQLVDSVQTAKKKFKINIQDVTSMMQSRFMGFPVIPSLGDNESSNVQKTITELKKKQSERTVMDFINKFGRDEINQIAENFRKEQAVSIKSFNKLFISSFEDTQKYLINLVNTKLSIFENQDIMENSRALIEDMADIIPLEGEILHDVNNMLLQYLSLVVSSYAMSRKSGKFMLLGMESGVVLEMDLEKLAIKKYEMKAKVTAIAISPNDEYFASGTADSEFMVRKTEGKMAKKKVANLNGQRVIAITFCENSSLFVATNHFLYFYKINSYALVLDVAVTTVINNSDELIVQVSSILHNGAFRISVAMEDRVVLFGGEREENKIKTWKMGQDIMFPLTGVHPNNLWIPMTSWFYPQSDSETVYLVLFWKNSISLLKLNITEYSLVQTKEVANGILWGAILDNKFLCVVNSNHEIEIMSVDKVFKNFFGADNIYFNIPMDPGFIRDQKDQGFIAKYKDRLNDDSLEAAHKINYFIFFKIRVKEIGKELFVSTNKGILRYRMISLSRQIEILASKGKFLSAIRLINNIALKKISCTLQDQQKAIYEAPKIVKMYLDKNLNNSLMTKEITQMVDIAVECLIYTAHLPEVFILVRPMFEQRTFWNQISRFIKEKKIVYMPLEYLKDGANYLETNDVIDMLRTVEIDAEKTDERIYQVLMIIKKKNIWSYFYKFCIFYPNQSIILFLSMLATEVVSMEPPVKQKILTEVFFEDLDRLDVDTFFFDEYRKVFFRIFWFINLILSSNGLQSSLSLFSDKQNLVKKNIPNILCRTLDWILDINNSKIVIDCSPQMFFQLFAQIFAHSALLLSPEVADLVKHIKASAQRKSDQTERRKGTWVVPQPSPIESDKPWTIIENMLAILGLTLEDMHLQELAFLAIKSLTYYKYEHMFKNGMFIVYMLVTVMKEQFLERRFWWDFHPIEKDAFEDVILQVVGQLEIFLSENPSIVKEVAKPALENK